MSQRQAVILLCFVGLLSVYYYLLMVADNCPSCAQDHQVIVDNTATLPNRWRILAPMLVEASGLPPITAYNLFHAVTIPVAILLLYTWLKRWMVIDRAFAGALLFAVFLPLVFQVYWFSPHSMLEVVFILSGVILLTEGRWWRFAAYAGLVALSALNRETNAVLLVLIFAAIHAPELRQGDKRVVGWLAVCVGLAMVTYALVRLSRGDAAHVLGLAGTWGRNTGGWYATQAVLYNLPFAPLWGYALWHYRQAPSLLRRLLWVVLLYVPMVLVGGTWYEVRLWLPALVLMLPVVLKGKAPACAGVVA